MPSISGSRYFTKQSRPLGHLWASEGPRILSPFLISEIPRIPEPAGTNEVVSSRSEMVDAVECASKRPDIGKRRKGKADDLDST